MRRRLIGVALGVLVGSVSLTAQGITSHTLRQYLVGAAQPVTTTVIPETAVTCNQTPPTGTSTLNPTKLVWDDPANAGKVCLYTDPGTGPLAATVYGALEGTLTNIAGTIEGVESNRAPFSRSPLAPTGFKAIR